MRFNSWKVLKAIQFVENKDSHLQGDVMTAACQPSGWQHEIPIYDTFPGKITFLEILETNSQKLVDTFGFLENQNDLRRDWSLQQFLLQGCGSWQKGRIKTRMISPFYRVSLFSETVLMLQFSDTIFS